MMDQFQRMTKAMYNYCARDSSYFQLRNCYFCLLILTNLPNTEMVASATTETVEEYNSTSMTSYISSPSVTSQSPTNNVSLVAVTTDDTFEYEDGIIGIATEVMVPAAIGLSIFILVGIAGNVMTILAYFEDRKYNNVYDFFILNLAIVDLIICSICMPFHAVYTLSNFAWPLGYVFCKVWLTIEYTATSEATLLILILSLDRLLMISLGSLYEQKVNWKFAKTALVTSWIIAFIYYGPVIIGWNHFVGYSVVPDLECDVEFADEDVLILIMTIIEFVAPVVGLTIINGTLLIKIWGWVNLRQNTNREKPIVASNEKQNTSTTTVTDETGKRIGRSGNAENAVVSDTEVRRVPNNSNRRTQESSKGTVSKKKKNRATASKGKLKSAKFLSSLVLAFLICWVPNEIIVLYMAICFETFCISNAVYEFFIWVLLTKSLVNPFLYAFNNPRYRRCFRRYITLNGRICKAESIN